VISEMHFSERIKALISAQKAIQHQHFSNFEAKKFFFLIEKLFDSL